MERTVLIGFLLGLLASNPMNAALAADSAPIGNARAGRAYAIQSCSVCHDVKTHEDSHVASVGAPSFHAIANAKTSTPMGLNVFLMTPHSTMPNLVIRERVRHDVIAYIMTFKDEKAPAPPQDEK